MIIPGAAISTNMNCVALLGVYAAIRKEEGLPLSYPGPAAGLNVTQMTDCRLLAKGCLHAATSEATRDDCFNLINGDVIEWRSAWPAIARTLGMQTGAEEEVNMAEYIKARDAVWKRVVQKHGIKGPDDVQAFLGESIHYAPVLFSPTPRPVVLSGYKLAQTGFTHVEDTEESLVYWFQNMQQRGLLPAP